MQLRNSSLMTAAALMLATACAVQAQSPGSTGGVQGGSTPGASSTSSGNATSGNTTSGSTTSRSTTSGTTASASTGAANSGAQDDRSFSAWLKRHTGRISRADYMSEMERRWDAADASKQGLTPADLSRIYGGQ